MQIDHTTCAEKKRNTVSKIIKIVDNSNFDARGQAESRKIGLETLRLTVFDQILIFLSMGQSKTRIKLLNNKGAFLISDFFSDSPH